MNKTDVKQQAIEYLNKSFEQHDYIDSAIFTLFEEALRNSDTKTELMKTFRNYCNQELGRSYLIGDAIYCELKDFITLYNSIHIYRKRIMI